MEDRAIFNAINRNDAQQVKRFIQSQHRLPITQYKNEGGWDLLLCSMYPEKKRIVKMLLEAGADPNVLSPTGFSTPLLMAMETGDAGLVNLLLKYGADPTFHGEDNFHEFVKLSILRGGNYYNSNHYEIFKFLVKNGFIDPLRFDELIKKIPRMETILNREKPRNPELKQIIQNIEKKKLFASGRASHIRVLKQASAGGGKRRQQKILQGISRGQTAAGGDSRRRQEPTQEIIDYIVKRLNDELYREASQFY